ncbi:MAG: PAS domain-containing protein [Planctomycetota bacterium]|nr:PAS domain-containing protein [Planctomycetota bacterium]
MTETIVLAAMLATAAVALLYVCRRQRLLQQAYDALQQTAARLQSATEELTREREFFHTLMNNIPDQIYFKDTQSRFLRVNRGVAAVLGVKTPDEAIGKTDADFFRPEDAQGFRTDDEKVMSTGKLLLDRVERALVGGAELWMSTSKAPVLDKAGKAVGLVGISRDITDRKRAEEELQRERDLLQVLMENIPDHIYFKDTEGRFTRVNKALARDSIYKTPEAVIGKTDFDGMPAEQAASYRADEERVLATGQPMLDKRQCLTFNGEPRWLSTTKAPIFDKNGKAIGIVGINRDITERQQAEEVLQNVVASARCILWEAQVTEKGGEYVWRLRVYSSDLTRAEFGLESLPGESDNVMWIRHIPAGQHEQLHRVSSAALRSGADGYQQEFLFRAASGKEFWLKEDVKIKRVAPGESHLVGVCVDVTERNQAQAALREREYLLRQVLDANPNLIFVRDSEGRLLLANKAFAAFYESTVDEVTGRKHEELHTAKAPRPEEVQQWLATDREIFATGQPKFHVNQATRPDGSVHWHRTRKLPLTLSNGVKAVLVICEDITDSRQTEADLHKERDLLQALMNNIPDNIYFKDCQSRFIRINSYQAYHMGLSDPSEAVGRTDFDFYPAERAQEFYADERAVVGGKRIISKVERQFVAGAPESWTLTSKVPFYGRDGQVLGIVGVSKDITELKKMERQLGAANEQLQKMAREDSLTGLLNRRMILDQADAEWARWQRYGKAFSILVIDADDFKNINDTYGHLVGDQALKLLAQTLARSVREVDTVGRYGGEEFVVLLPETTLDGARAAGEKVLQNVRRATLEVEGEPLQVTVSVGAAMSTLGDKDIDTLLHRADAALYTAKRQGKNRLVAAPA